MKDNFKNYKNCQVNNSTKNSINCSFIFVLFLLALIQALYNVAIDLENSGYNGLYQATNSIEQAGSRFHNPNYILKHDYLNVLLISLKY